VKAQDEKIKVLMSLASKYEEEINNLKGGRLLKLDNNMKYVSKKSKDNGGQTILTTTDISSAESPASDNSGFNTNKEPKETITTTTTKNMNFSSSAQGQRQYKDLLSKHHQAMDDPRLKRKGNKH